MTQEITLTNFYTLLITKQKSKDEFKKFLNECRQDWRNIRQYDINDLKNSMLIYDLFLQKTPLIDLLSLNTPYLRKKYLIDYQMKRLGF